MVLPDGTQTVAPFSSLALLLVRNRVYEKARAEAGVVAASLRGLGGANLQVLGPAPAPLERLRGEYRVQVLLKAVTRRTMRETLAGMLSDLDRRGRRVGSLVIDVDPMSTL